MFDAPPEGREKISILPTDDVKLPLAAGAKLA